MLPSEMFDNIERRITSLMRLAPSNDKTDAREIRDGAVYMLGKLRAYMAGESAPPEKAPTTNAGPFVTRPEYESLANVLARALSQAANGKGRERHANPGERFEDQQICTLNRWLGDSHGAVFQICKKAIESQRLDTEAGVRELLGAIVYAAAAIVEMEWKAQEKLDVMAPDVAEAKQRVGRTYAETSKLYPLDCPNCRVGAPCTGHD